MKRRIVHVIYLCFVVLGGILILTATLYWSSRPLGDAGSWDPWFGKRATVAVVNVDARMTKRHLALGEPGRAVVTWA